MQTISEKIFETFFSKLTEVENVKPETIESLRTLYQTNQLANKGHVTRLVRDMERRHAQDQNTDR